MTIAISATGKDLNADVDPRFGRCQYFIIADPETSEFEAVENSNAMASGGAGIAAAQMIAGKKVKAVLTGNCGPNAYEVLSAAGIKVMTGVTGKVQEAIEGFKSGKFQPISRANVAPNFGVDYTAGGAGKNMGPGMAPGMGPGMRRGMGRGMGGGMGRRMGRGMGRGGMR